VLLAAAAFGSSPLATSVCAPASGPNHHEAPDTVHAVDAEGGTRWAVDPRRAPHAASIAKLVIDPPSAEHPRKACTATLLPGERHVLTALHCLYGAPAEGELGPGIPARGDFTLVFGFRRGDWIVHQAAVVHGRDLFAEGAVRAWPEYDLAVVRLPIEVDMGRVHYRYGRVELEEPTRVALAQALGELRGIPLLGSSGLPPAGPLEGAGTQQPLRAGTSVVRAYEARRAIGGLYAYASDVEVGRRGEVLTVDVGCSDAFDPSVPRSAEPAGVWTACRGYPGGSGGPYLIFDRRGAPWVAGVAIEAEHESRRVHIIRSAAFREQVRAALRRDRSGPLTEPAAGVRRPTT
jgi:hypothetical protein